MNARRATIKEPVPLEDERTNSEKEADLQAAENDKTQEPYEQEPEEEVEEKPAFTGGEGPEEAEILPDSEPEPWHPGAACLDCGNPNPRLTVGWGHGCDKCLVPDED